MNKDNQTKVAVIIPSFNRRKVTEKCVETLLQGSYANLKIMICDSGSGDGTTELFQDNNVVSVINVGREAWWTAAVNKGVLVALEDDYEFVLVLNDDIDIPKSLIECMLNKARNYPHKIISPAQESERKVFLGIKYQGIFKIPEILSSSVDGAMGCAVMTSNGCCLLIPRMIFGEIGLFDEVNCPHLYGDTEFQLRAWSHGLGTMAFSDIVIVQHANTDYLGKTFLKGLFNQKGSPINFRAYIAFGRALFRGNAAFVVYGVAHHWLYMRALLKILYLLLCRSVNLIKRKNLI